MNDRVPYEEHTKCSMCSTMSITGMTVKVHTQKDLVLLDVLITEFHEKFYILAIQKIEFLLPHMRILSTHHRGK